MLATSTHDTKRSEDVRARIAVLSELPELWKRHLARWTRLNRSKRSHLEERPAPDREDEYLLYQTLVGIWSPDISTQQLIDRLQAYAVKAAREAKRSTSWVSPNAEYEKALCDFVEQLLGNPERNAFLHDFAPFAATVAYFGRINSLAQTVLKIASPGVPDFYQGTELPVLTLVDPDNRQPVDFGAAAQQLESLAAFDRPLGSLLADAAGAALSKLHVTTKLLHLRRRDPELFARGAYQPLPVDGDRKEHVLAFARTYEERSCIVIVPRWTARLMNGQTDLPAGSAAWGDARINLGAGAPSTLTDVFTGQRLQIDAQNGESFLSVAAALRELPVAVLYSEHLN